MTMPPNMDDSEARFVAGFKDAVNAVSAAPLPQLHVRPNLKSATVTAAILDAQQRELWTDKSFNVWVGVANVERDVCADVRASGKARMVHTVDRDGRPLLLTYAPQATARHWPLAMAEEARARLPKDAICVGALSLSHLSDEVILVGRALGLGNLEARVMAALVLHGSVRSAAAHAGVTYQTARSAVADALAITGMRRQTALVRKLSELATGAIAPRDAALALLSDVFHLSERDARLALLLCQGHTRNQAAALEGLSPATGKDCFRRIFQQLSLRSVTDMPRRMMEAFAAAMLLQSQPPVRLPDGRQRTPLRLVQRPDGTMIAVSDFGPAGAQPVLILHSSLSTRHPFQTVIKQLQHAGFRPITMDRPGFGLTDDVDDPGDPFAAGAADVDLVCAALDIEQVRLLTRGGSFAALALARACPHRVRRAVLINPDLLHSHCSTRKGHLGVVRLAFDHTPSAVEAMARWAAAQLSPKRARTYIRMAIKDMPVDRKSFADPDVEADYVRSIMAFATGTLTGFVREQRGYATLRDVEGLEDGSAWTILLGDADPLHETDDMLRVWKDKLPGVRVRRITGGNRYLSLSHMDAVIDALGR